MTISQLLPRPRTLDGRAPSRHGGGAARPGTGATPDARDRARLRRLATQHPALAERAAVEPTAPVVTLVRVPGPGGITDLPRLPDPRGRLAA